jgi:hypothetical protein
VWLTAAIVTMDVPSPIVKMSAPFADTLHSHYIIAVPAYQLVANSGRVKHVSHTETGPQYEGRVFLSLHTSLSPEQHLSDWV